MNVLYILVPLALMLAGVAVWAFVWSVINGQFEDVETPGMRMLFDEEHAVEDPADLQTEIRPNSAPDSPES